VDHPNLPAVEILAPSSSIQVKSNNKLESHIGVVTAAAAAALGAALQQKFKNGAVDAQTRLLGGETIAELLKLYFLTASSLDFFRVARERGIEVLVESDLSSSAVEFFVDEVLKILAAATRDRLN